MLSSAYRQQAQKVKQIDIENFLSNYKREEEDYQDLLKKAQKLEEEKLRILGQITGEQFRTEVRKNLYENIEELKQELKERMAKRKKRQIALRKQKEQMQQLSSEEWKGTLEDLTNIEFEKFNYDSDNNENDDDQNDNNKY